MARSGKDRKGRGTRSGIMDRVFDISVGEGLLSGKASYKVESLLIINDSSQIPAPCLEARKILRSQPPKTLRKRGPRDVQAPTSRDGPCSRGLGSVSSLQCPCLGSQLAGPTPGGPGCAEPGSEPKTSGSLSPRVDSRLDSIQPANTESSLMEDLN